MANENHKLMEQLAEEGRSVAVALRSPKAPKQQTFKGLFMGCKLRSVTGWRLCEPVRGSSGEYEGVKWWLTYTFILAVDGGIHAFSTLCRSKGGAGDYDNSFKYSEYFPKAAHEQALEGLKKLAASVA